MGLLKKYLLESIEKMERDQIRLHFFGDLSPLPAELREMCGRTDAISQRYDGMQVNVCLNYGGRDEIVRAARAFAADCAAGEDHAGAADGGGLFPIPLLRRGARPGPGDPAQRGNTDFQLPAVAVGLRRVLLHRRAVARFSKEELHKALAAYQGRSRRFGGV